MFHQGLEGSVSTLSDRARLTGWAVATFRSGTGPDVNQAGGSVREMAVSEPIRETVCAQQQSPPAP